MDPTRGAPEPDRFGIYLRHVRERRRMTLEEAEALTSDLPERVSKSYLSELEQGKTPPSLRKLLSLAVVYDIPVAAMAERYEVEQKLRSIRVETSGEWSDSVFAEIEAGIDSGDYLKTLALCSRWRERLELNRPEGDREPTIRRLRLHEINALIHLRCWRSAREEAEEFLRLDRLTPDHELIAWHSIAACAYRLKRFAVAESALRQEELLVAEAAVRMDKRAAFLTLKANVLVARGDHAGAVPNYEEAARCLESGNPRELCRIRINLAVALLESARVERARFELTTALDTAVRSGFPRQEALARSELGRLLLRLGDEVGARKHLLRSNELARALDYAEVYFRNCWYLRSMARRARDARGVASWERALRVHASRVDEDLPEVRAYRSETGRRSVERGDA